MVASLILRRAATALRTPSTPLPTLASRTAPRYPVSASRIAFPTRFYATPSDRKPGQGADEAAPKDPTEPGSSQAGSSDAKAEAPRAPPRGGSAFDVDTSAPEHAARTQASLTEQLVDADSAGAASQATGDSATGASGDVATTPGQSGAGGQGRTGAKAKAKSMSSIERRRQHTTRALGAAVLAALGFAGWELGRDWDTEKEWLRHREVSVFFFERRLAWR